MSKTIKIGGVELPINQEPEHELVPGDGFFVETNGLLHSVASGVKENLPILMVGPTGCGKTSVIRHVANQTKNAFVRMNLNGNITVDEFVGKTLLNKEGTYWVDGRFTRAVRKGHWVLLDEINAALPEILFVLHSVLDDDGFLALDEKDGEVVKKHPNFRFFAAMNPVDTYSGTKELNPALKDRFPLMLSVDYPREEDELNIVIKHLNLTNNPVQGSLTKEVCIGLGRLATDMRSANKEEKLVFDFSTRLILNLATLFRVLPSKKVFEVGLFARLDPSSVAIAKQLVKLYFTL